MPFPAAGVSDPHRHHHVLEILVSRHRNQYAGIGIPERTLYFGALQVVEHVLQVIDVETYVQGLA